MKMLLNSTVDALNQVKQLIEAFDNDSAAALYNVPPQGVLSGVGKHVRHILDHFLAFQQGLISGCVDYNVRHRDGRLESDTRLALALLDDMVRWLHQEPLVDRALTVESEISVSHTISQRFDSSLSRELCYLINHTVHHVAYAKLLTQQHGIELDPEVGIAPSTASYLRGQKV